MGFEEEKLTPKCADVQILDDVQKKSLQWTEKTIFHPFNLFFLFLVTRVQFRFF